MARTTVHRAKTPRGGYPDYEDIMDERQRRRRQEIEGGRQRTFKVMAESLIERIQKDYKLMGKATLDASHPDPRQWTVTIEQGDLLVVEENFWNFPSDELVTKMMLLGMAV